MKSENKIQQDLFQYFWNYETQTRRLIYHFNNESEPFPGESKMSFRRRLSKMAALGVVKGACDLIILSPKKVVWLELKRPDGKVSEDQKMCADSIKSAGYETKIAWNYDDAFEIICDAFDISLESEKVLLYSNYKK